MTTTRPRTPSDLGPSGRRLWRSAVADYALAEHELAQLLQAARLADTLNALAEVLAREGVTVADPATGDSRPHPVLVELRHQRLALSRLLAALRVPDEDDQRPQRRTGVRGPYRPRSAS